MKKILIFSLVYYPRFVGGAEIAVKELTDRSDVEFDMITLRLEKSLPVFERVGSVNVHRIGFCADREVRPDSLGFFLSINKYLFPFMACVKAISLHRKRTYDATWSMMANYAGFAALFFKYLYSKVPFILTLQEGDPIEHILKRVGLLKPLFRKIFTKADYIQVISHYLSYFAREMGYTGKIEVISNGVDTTLFGKQKPEVELAQLRTTLEKKYFEKYLITTSRLVLKNAVGDVIKALPLLPEHVIFIIIGIGPEEEYLKKLAKDLSVSHRVRFLGFVPHAQLPGYLQISDIFIRPSRSEGFGNSFIEAMAAGLPVIATRVGGIVDFISSPEETEHPTGLFCEVDKPATIAEQVQKILNNDPLRQEIIQSAKMMVMQKYDWNMIAHTMNDFFMNSVFKKHD